MAVPRFLTLDQVLRIHARVLEIAGGEDGVLKPAELESAIAAPRATYGGDYLNTFPFEMAAAYIVGLARNHAFVDGNKRVAAIAGSAFLKANGYELQLSTRKYEEVILSTATGHLKKAELAALLTESCKRA